MEEISITSRRYNRDVNIVCMINRHLLEPSYQDTTGHGTKNTVQNNQYTSQKWIFLLQELSKITETTADKLDKRSCDFSVTVP